MDERHWFLNTSFSGFVLVVFFILTCWGMTVSIPYQDKFLNGKDYQLLKIIGIATAAMIPLLGMLVKIFSIVFFRTFFQYKAYPWKLMDGFVKERLQAPFQARHKLTSREIYRELEKADTDPIVTWLRINQETKEMSEWRRNRGHYMHFAENSLTATVLGIISSIYWLNLSGYGGKPIACLQFLCHVGGECISSPEWDLILRSILFIVPIAVWIVFLHKLRSTMHKINNDMLLLWMLDKMGLADKNEVLSIRILDDKVSKELL